MTIFPRLVLFTRFPKAGRAKTRLIPAIGAAAAAALHRRLAERTVEKLSALDLDLEIWTTGARQEDFQSWLGVHNFVEQGSGDLGVRMLRAFQGGPALIIGSDIPDLTAEDVAAAAAALGENDLVIGPAEDGGYWMIGMQRPRPELFAGVAWGTETVRAQTLANASGLSIYLAPMRADLDRPEDLEKWPHLIARS